MGRFVEVELQLRSAPLLLVGDDGIVDLAKDLEHLLLIGIALSSYAARAALYCAFFFPKVKSGATRLPAT